MVGAIYYFTSTVAPEYLFTQGTLGHITAAACLTIHLDTRTAWNEDKFDIQHYAPSNLNTRWTYAIYIDQDQVSHCHSAGFSYPLPLSKEVFLFAIRINAEKKTFEYYLNHNVEKSIPQSYVNVVYSLIPQCETYTIYKNGLLETRV
tara:strand:+ start:40649 stop:41089 length:441 start_codon:yes stop_codon:yes gene_type:complete